MNSISTTFGAHNALTKADRSGLLSSLVLPVAATLAALLSQLTLSLANLLALAR
ncbi:hypothetical protein H8K35_04430 [Undibacterium sp. LX40W]|uniref:hypothetical protein n=1 Tax=Undibacterium TaxID=401469 RepID=UPI00164CAA66|nr:MULTISPECIES: hypothetical protein [Undibacterium]MBC3890897.1 hypothetical protein [Undibacterium sp. LX40W]